LDLQKALSEVKKTIKIIEDVIIDKNDIIIDLPTHNFYMKKHLLEYFESFTNELSDRTIKLRVFNEYLNSRNKFKNINASLDINLYNIDEGFIEIDIGFYCLFLKKVKIGYKYKITKNHIAFINQDLFIKCLNNKMLNIMIDIFETIIIEIDVERGNNV